MVAAVLLAFSRMFELARTSWDFSRSKNEYHEMPGALRASGHFQLEDSQP